MIILENIRRINLLDVLGLVTLLVKKEVLELMVIIVEAGGSFFPTKA